MLCNPVSYYPNQIDEMIFFQDNNLENIEAINYYNSLVAQGNYDEANDYINQQSGIYGYFSDFFNLIENRIYSLQKYLLKKPPKEQPFMYYDEKLHFRTENISIFTDTDEIEPLETIQLFSDSDVPEPLEPIQIFINDNEEEKEPVIGEWEEEKEPDEAPENAIWI